MRALFSEPAGLVVLLLVIVMFGAKRLPDAAKSLGKSINIFKSELNNGKDTQQPISEQSNQATTSTSSDQ